MNYNFIKTNDIVKSILEINNINKKDLKTDYDFIIKDEVFLSFKETLESLKEKKFLIVGDYDCDGICATTIIKRLFNFLNIQSNFYIPSRLKEGYGLNNSIVDTAIKNNFDVILCVDNGIVCLDQIELAKENDIDVLIIDHHEYDTLPDCKGIIHSNIVDKKYGELSAAGLSFVLSRLFYEDNLSLVLGGLATISDMMPVLGFNRYLIKEMMNTLVNNDIYQMKLLNDNKTFDYEDLSFTVIPKINAISRMEPLGNANHVVRFLLSSKEECLKMIKEINHVNDLRKQETKNMLTISESLINDDNILLLIDDNFKEGLCGLLANRALHQENKPVIVLTLSDGVYKGSGRSIDGFNLYEALLPFNKFESYGGHANAVGLSFKKEYLNEFKEFISKLTYSDDTSNDALLVDEELLNNELLETLESLKPFGMSFKEPLLVIENKDYKKIDIKGLYPKYTIRSDLSAISFNTSHKDINPKYLIGKLKKDTYNKNSLSFSIEDLTI